MSTTTQTHQPRQHSSWRWFGHFSRRLSAGKATSYQRANTSIQDSGQKSETCWTQGAAWLNKSTVAQGTGRPQTHFFLSSAGDDTAPHDNQTLCVFASTSGHNRQHHICSKQTGHTRALSQHSKAARRKPLWAQQLQLQPSEPTTSRGARTTTVPGTRTGSSTPSHTKQANITGRMCKLCSPMVETHLAKTHPEACVAETGCSSMRKPFHPPRPDHPELKEVNRPLKCCDQAADTCRAACH